MKTLSIIIFSLISITSYGQQAQSFKILPTDNKMADKSIDIYNQILKNETKDIISVLDQSKTTKEELKQYWTFLSKSKPMDTLMTEFYSSNKTEISFRLRCKEKNKTIDYWVKTSANGVSGSTKDFVFWVEKDEKFSKMEDLIMNTKIKK
jgi:hypothetical protein